MKNEVSIGHQPQQGQGTWVFDQEVVKVFDDMLERSVPLYHQAHQLIASICDNVVPDNGLVVDLGVSTAKSFTLLDFLKDRNVAFIGVDESSEMLVRAKEAYARASYYNSRLQYFCNIPKFTGHRISLQGMNLFMDATILSLTLQFVPIEHRQSILVNIYNRTNPNGVIFLFEKCLGESAEQQEFYTDIYYKFKSQGGYDKNSITKKREALENVLVPLPRAMNEKLLTDVGFETHHLLCWCNFNLWVGIKK